MLKHILMALGWRGSDCKLCNFCEATHTKPDIQWHPDSYPCKHFKEEYLINERTTQIKASQ
jgi:hypothetical protein